MAELELGRGAAQGLPKDLVTETDAEDGRLAEQLADGVNDVGQGGRIAGAVAQEHPVGFVHPDLPGRCLARDHDDIAAPLFEIAEDVVLDAAVDDDDAQAILRFCFSQQLDGLGPIVFPEIGLLAGHKRDQVPSHETRIGPDLVEQEPGVVRFRGEDALHGPGKADPAGECPRVDSLDAELLVLLEEFLEGLARPPVAGEGLILLDDESLEVDLRRFHILGVDPVAADEGIGHRHDLLFIGGIGQDFLVARHSRVEDDLAHGLSHMGEGITPGRRSRPPGQAGLWVVFSEDAWLRFPDALSDKAMRVVPSGSHPRRTYIPESLFFQRFVKKGATRRVAPF